MAAPAVRLEPRLDGKTADVCEDCRQRPIAELVVLLVPEKTEQDKELERLRVRVAR